MANEARHIQPVGAKRGTYSKLNPQFAEIVDFFCSSEEDAERLSDSSIRSSACLVQCTAGGVGQRKHSPYLCSHRFYAILAETRADKCKGTRQAKTAEVYAYSPCFYYGGAYKVLLRM